MNIRRRTALAAGALLLLLLLPGGALACACCSNAGDYHAGSARPGAHEMGLLRRMRFGGTAYLFLTEAGLEEMSRGIAGAAENYSLTGSLTGNAWRLSFRAAGQTGTLSLPLPARMSTFHADIHDGQTSGGGGPLLYKEWRFEGRASGTGIFRAGLAAPARYTLVLQGRGNGCADAADFTHWRLQVTGPRADYAFYGELGEPAPRGRD